LKSSHEPGLNCIELGGEQQVWHWF